MKVLDRISAADVETGEWNGNIIWNIKRELENTKKAKLLTQLIFSPI